MVFDKCIRTFPTSGILTVFSILGSFSGTIEAISFVMSKSLMKSRPFWDITIDVKDSSSVPWTWESICEATTKSKQALPMFWAFSFFSSFCRGRIFNVLKLEGNVGYFIFIKRQDCPLKNFLLTIAFPWRKKNKQ